MKLTVSKSKNSASFYVQKSIRTPSGRVTTVTVEKLGNLDEVRAKAGGGDPYAWAQAYVDELNRKEYEERTSIIVSYSPSKLVRKGEHLSSNCGYLFLQDICYGLGINRICEKIKGRHLFEYDLNDILLRLIYTRILYPSSKRSSLRLSEDFLEPPSFKLHDVYRALSVLAQEGDFIQSELYKNRTPGTEGRTVLYYDCTNYYFEIEEEDALRRYGKGKQHQPLPLVGMGLFMDQDGIPLAFSTYPGNRNEQPTLKPLEQKVVRDFGIGNIVVCTDAGLSSAANRRFNDKSINGEQVRSFITTQSIKMLPEYLKEFALGDGGWRLPGDGRVYSLSEIDMDTDYDRVFYKDRWIKEDLTGTGRDAGTRPLEQHLIVSFSPKYKKYQETVRARQVERAMKVVADGTGKRRGKSQNDPMRFVGEMDMTADGEACTRKELYLDKDAVAKEALYDGFYAVCTNLGDTCVEDVVRVNRKRWQIEECFRIMKTEFKTRPVYLSREDRINAHFLTCFLALVVYRVLEKRLGEKFTCSEIVNTLREMRMYRQGAKQGYSPAYTRTDLTDALHDEAGFRTDFEILTEISMKKVIRQSKKRKPGHTPRP